jgi:L-threonylcarbamoyladenylate synthase
MTELDDALEALDAGGLVVIPTDTVYGIAAALIPDAIAKVFEIKGRPRDKPLPVLGASSLQLERVATLDDRARRLADDYWPGPLTLVLPRASGFEIDLGRAGDASVAIRVPDHALARLVLERSGPLAVTSANPSGEGPATTVDETRRWLGDRVGAYLDGGRCVGAEPSTVLSLTDGPKLVRVGPIPERELLQRLTS